MPLYEIRNHQLARSNGRNALAGVLSSPLQTRQKRAVVAALLLLGGLALWTRAQFIEMYGGREPSYLAWAETHYFGGISGFYVNMAAAWNRGEAYDNLLYPPGYVMVLAAMSRVAGGEPAQLRRAQAVVDSATVVGVYLLAVVAGASAPWALAAAAAYAVLPLWAAGSTFLLAESIGVPLLVWELVMIVSAARTRSVLMAALAGVWLGFGALVRPDFLLFACPAVIVLLIGRPMSRTMQVLAFVAAFSAVIGAWGWHNRRAHGVWVFTSTGGGDTLWEGLGEIPNDFGYAADDSAAHRLMQTHGYTWGSVDGNRFMTREFLKGWRDHPLFALRLVGLRVRRILFTSDRLQPLFFSRGRLALDALGFAMLALAVWIKHRDPMSVALLLILPLYALGSIGLVHYEARYVRYVPVAYVLASAVIASAIASFGIRRSTATVGVVTVLVTLMACLYTTKELVAIRAAAQIGITQP